MTRKDINILQDIVDIYEKEDMYPTLNDKQLRMIKRAIKALEQESCEDTISRKAAIESMYAMHMHGKEGVLSDIENLHGSEVCFSETIADAVEKLEDLPSVTSQQKKGYWIKTRDIAINVHEVECSECFALAYFRKTYDGKYVAAKICPNCGAKMEEMEE